MSPEQPQLPADRRRPAALFDFGFGRAGIEQRLQVPIAQAVDSELATIDGL